LNATKALDNASLTFFQLLCFDVTVTTPHDKSFLPREILSGLDRNAYTTSRPRMSDDSSLVTVTLTFLNQKEYRDHFRKLMFRMQLEFGDNITVEAKGDYHSSASC
jgi:hypothetical protein